MFLPAPAEIVRSGQTGEKQTRRRKWIAAYKYKRTVCERVTPCQTKCLASVDTVFFVIFCYPTVDGKSNCCCLRKIEWIFASFESFAKILRGLRVDLL